MSTKCTNCGGFCPSGTLENGLCLDCDLIGKVIIVRWARFGASSCLVDRVSRNGVVYARRWMTSLKGWTAPRAIEYYKGWHLARE